MPKTIKQIRAEIVNDAALRLRLQAQATELLLKVLGEPMWTDFIDNFIDNDNPDQLRRLTLQDSMANDPYIRRSLTYLMSTPICGMATPSALGDEVLDILDVGISSQVLEAAAKEREEIAIASATQEREKLAEKESSES